MPRGNPALTIAAEQINAAEQAIAHCVSIGHELNRLLAQTTDPAIVAVALRIASHAGAIKHIAQEQRTKEQWT